MKRMTLIIGMCLASVVAFSAIGTAGAFANEHIPYLFKFSKGNINEGGTFTSKGATAELATEGSEPVICETTENKGEFLGLKGTEHESEKIGAHLGLVTIVFKKCSTKALGSSFKCGNEGSSENITLLKWLFHLVAGFDPTLNEWGPAILILIGKVNSKNEASGEFEFTCAGVVKVVVKAKSITGVLVKSGTKELVKTKTLLASTGLNFAGEAGKKFKLLFTKVYLPLQKEEETESTFESSISGGAFKPSEEIAGDTLEGFENSAKEKVELELEEA